MSAPNVAVALPPLSIPVAEDMVLRHPLTRHKHTHTNALRRTGPAAVYAARAGETPAARPVERGMCVSGGRGAALVRLGWPGGREAGAGVRGRLGVPVVYIVLQYCIYCCV